MPYANREDYLAMRKRVYERDKGYDQSDWRKHLAQNTPPAFVACDGEGYITDEVRAIQDDLFWQRGIRQEYGLLRMGKALLYTGKGLSSEECLQFIVDQPTRRTYIGYYFDYDVTMLLRDLPSHVLRRILAGLSTVWERWVIRYYPRQFLQVGIRDGESTHAVKNSIVIINDVGTFFQCSFTKALQQWNVGDPAVVERIQQGKDRRGTETAIDDDTITYNALECDYLELLMTEFAKVVIDVDLRPAQWRGPGWIAAKALRNNNVMKRKTAEPMLPDELRMTAPMAYYGGRFEVTKIGDVGKAYAHDLNSAYPAAMQYLPCLEHCRITPWRKGDPITSHALLNISFDHPTTNALCGIPIRGMDGVLTFPRMGKGWYWGVEILAAIAAGMKATVYSGWHIHTRCDCAPFAFVRDLYEERKRVGKENKGIALKLAYNSIYGKLVQHVGERPYYNPVWAGLITAYVRSWIIDAYRDYMPHICMIATDAVYTDCPLDHLPFSKELGQWSAEETDNIFIVQPGIYEAVGRSFKTRGINSTILREAMPEFRRVWAEFSKSRGSIPPAPEVKVHAFIGLKLAAARNNFASAGTWEDAPRRINFDWSGKRERNALWCNDHVVTQPHPGYPALTSAIYDPHLLYVQRELDMMQDAQPDPHGKLL